MRREQTAAIARAVRRLVDDRRLWLVDAGALAFTGLDGIAHGFEHPAEYELAMALRPGDTPPRALELAGALGMTAPSLAPTDWPELVSVVDSDWAARHPAVDLLFSVKAAGRALSSEDAVWGP